MAKKPANIPENETKADAFKRVAGSRTEKALAAIALIGGAANTANYEYTPDQVTKLIGYLEGEVIRLRNRFANPTAKVQSTVQL